MSLCSLVVPWWLGLCLGVWLDLAPYRVPLALIALMLGLLLYAFASACDTGGRRPKPAAWQPPTLALAALASGLALSPRRVPADRHLSGVFEIRGEVQTPLPLSEEGRWKLRVVEALPLKHSQALPRGAGLQLRGKAPPAGSSVRFVARVEARPAFYNPSPHPPWPSVDAYDYDARVLAWKGVRVLKRSVFDEKVHRLRQGCAEVFRASLAPAVLPMALAVFLGETAELDKEDRRVIRDCGLSHVLAVSGMHVLLLVGLWMRLLDQGLRFLPWVYARYSPRRLAALFAAPSALFYAAFTGGSASAWRAGLSAALQWGLIAAGRRPKALETLAFALLVLGTVSPTTLASPGGILSALATAILLHEGEVETNFLRANLHATLRTALATAPFVIYCFGNLPLVSLPANLLMVPIGSTLLLPALFLHLVLAFTLPWLLPLSAWACSTLALGFLNGAEWMSQLSWGRELPPPTLVQGLLLASACAAWPLARSKRLRVACLLVCTSLYLGEELRLRHFEHRRGVLRLGFLDIGQGDAALVDLPRGALMLVDAGGLPERGADPGKHALLPLLQARRRGHIDLAILTHEHPDHYGGMSALLDSVSIGEVWINAFPSAQRAPEFLALIHALQKRGTRIRSAESLCRAPIERGGVELRVLAPCPWEPGWSANDNSLVVEMRYGTQRMLFTGDIEARAEARLRERGQLRPVDLLKVAHHGSRTSSSETFLQASSPSMAVVSCGRLNRFAHPHPEVLSRLEAHIPRVLRTDTLGGLVLEARGKGPIRVLEEGLEE